VELVDLFYNSIEQFRDLRGGGGGGGGGDGGGDDNDDNDDEQVEFINIFTNIYIL
jgi:hypothetical protein